MCISFVCVCVSIYNSSIRSFIKNLAMFTEGLRDLHVIIFWWGSFWILGKKDNEGEETFFHWFRPSIGIGKHYFISKLDQLSFPDPVLWGFNSIHFLLVKLISPLLTYLESDSISHSIMPHSLQSHGLYGPPGSSVHRIPQARILEWVDIPFSRASSQPMDQTQVSCISGRFFTIWATREALLTYITGL